MCVFVGVCVYVCVLAYVWLSLCMHVPNQPEHKNHWQANWLTLIVLLQCGVLLEKKKKLRSWHWCGFNLTRITCPNTIESQVHPLIVTALQNGSGPPSRTMGDLTQDNPQMLHQIWNMGNLEARLMPWALRYVPLAIPKQSRGLAGNIGSYLLGRLLPSVSVVATRG